MANRVTELVTRLIARDDASKVIEHVADDLDKLEKRKDVEIGIKADDKASDQVRELDRRLDGLSDEDKTIVLRAQAKDAQREVDRLVRSLKDVDRLDDEEVKIRVDALGDAKRELKAIEDQAERLDREKVDIEVDADTRGATSAISKLRSDVAASSGVMGKASTLMSGAVTALSSYGPQAAAAAAAAVGLFVRSAVTDFQTLALEVGKMSDSLGIPAEEASRLKEVVEDLGIPIEAFQVSITKMNKAAELTPGAFADIGAEVVRSKDGVLDVTETFLSAATALDEMPDAGKRAAAGAKIFGKAWTQIAELVEKGGLSIREAMDEVLEGKLVEDEDVRNARDMREAVDTLVDSYESFANTVGSEMLPAITKLAEGVTLLGDVFQGLQGDLPGPALLDNTLGRILRYGNPITGGFNAMTDAMGLAGKAWGGLFGGDGPTEAEKTAEAISGLNEQLTALADQKDPLSVMSDEWKILMADMRDGTIDTKAAADSAELLAGALGKTTEEVLAIGDAEIDRQFKDAGAALVEALKKAAATEAASDAAYAQRRRAQQQRIKDEANAAKDAAREFADALEDAAVAAGETQIAIDDVGGVFEQMSTRSDALSSIFDLKNASLDAQADVRDVALAIEDLSEVDVDLSKAARHEEILDRIDALRPQIQERIIEAFSGGGPEAAKAMAEDYIAQVATELGISEIEAAELLGLTDIQATIGVAVDQADLANAQAQLTLLTGIPGADPVWLAQVQLALAAGDITAQGASRLVQDKLRDAGVNIPASLVVPTTKEQLHTAMVNAGLLDPKPIPAPLIPDPALLDESIAARDGTDITVDIYPNWIESLAGLFGLGGGGGTTGGGGADTFAVGPMATATTTGPVATTTSSAMPMLALPRAAPSSRSVVINQVIQAAVIGAPWDVARAVEAANRKTIRLMPRNP